MRRITYLTFLAPLILGVLIALCGEEWIKDFSDGWIGFIATFSGIISTAFIMIFIMQKTNEINRKIQEKNSRTEFSNKLAELTGAYVATVNIGFESLKEMWGSIKIINSGLEISNEEYHERKISKYSELCEIEFNKAEAIFFTLDIQLKSIEGTGYIIKKLHEVRCNSKNRDIGFLDFEKGTAQLMEMISIFIKEYTKLE